MYLDKNQNQLVTCPMIDIRKTNQQQQQKTEFSCLCTHKIDGRVHHILHKLTISYTTLVLSQSRISDVPTESHDSSPAMSELQSFFSSFLTKMSPTLLSEYFSVGDVYYVTNFIRYTDF